MKITVLDISHIEHKRQRGTLRTPENLDQDDDLSIA